MKKQIINNLLPLLDRAGGIRYVVEPQSPFVMDNPDVLAIVNNSIFGIYVPSSYEKKNIDSFLRRVYVKLGLGAGYGFEVVGVDVIA